MQDVMARHLRALLKGKPQHEQLEAKPALTHAVPQLLLLPSRVLLIAGPCCPSVVDFVGCIKNTTGAMHRGALILKGRHAAQLAHKKSAHETKCLVWMATGGVLNLRNSF